MIKYIYIILLVFIFCLDSFADDKVNFAYDLNIYNEDINTIYMSQETGINPNFGWFFFGQGSGFYETGMTHGEIKIKDYKKVSNPTSIPSPNALSAGFVLLFAIISNRNRH